MSERSRGSGRRGRRATTTVFAELSASSRSVAHEMGHRARDASDDARPYPRLDRRSRIRVRRIRNGPDARGLLAGASLSVGLAGAVGLRLDEGATLASAAWVLGLTIVIASAYALAGYLGHRVYAALRHWAFAGHAPHLSREQAMFVAAFWPVALLYGVTVYLVQGVIERLF